MEWRYVIGPAIAFILSLIAFIPLVKYRLKSTEVETAQQRRDIEKNKDGNHRLELLILQNENDSHSKSMDKMAEALLLVADSNAKFQSILETQNIMIQKISETAARAHSRIDENSKENAHELGDIREKYVSHPFLIEALKNKG